MNEIIRKKNSIELKEEFDALVEKYGIDKIIELVNKFTPKYKELFFMYYGVNCKVYTREEISNRLNISLGAILNIARNILYEIGLMLEDSSINYYYTKTDKFYNVSDLCKKFNVTESELKKRIEELLKKLNRILNSLKNR